MKTKWMMQLGLVCLILANVLTRYVKPSTDLSDALMGMLYGMAIALLLLFVRSRARRAEC